MAKTVEAISAMPDEALLDKYLAFTLKPGDLDLTDRVLLGLLRAEWNNRHPEDPMPSTPTAPSSTGG